MRTIRFFAVCGFLFLSYKLASATVIGVPADYSTIQMAIDSSSTGDTVLVQPNTYFENINFNGKNITLGSLFLTTGDTSYISTTIMDGGSSGSVVTFNSGEDSSAAITGFTIQNGQAVEGGGIYCVNSGPTISYNVISANTATTNYGGGIYCYLDSGLTISNNIIRGNSSAFYGGGIYSFESFNLTISYNIIYGNTAGSGGGIFCGNDSPVLVHNTISGNSANFGGGIFIWTANPVITNTILWADTAQFGPEIYLNGGSVTVDYCDVQGGWGGTSNINCDPMFCDPASANYYLADTSCCVGAGQGGVDIGALGVGCGLMTIPTLNEWGMLIMGLLLLTAGTIAVIRRKKAAINNTA